MTDKVEAGRRPLDRVDYAAVEADNEQAPEAARVGQRDGPSVASLALLTGARGHVQAAHILRMQHVQGNQVVCRLIAASRPRPTAARLPGVHRMTSSLKDEGGKVGVEDLATEAGQATPLDAAPTVEVPTPPPLAPPSVPPPAPVQRNAGDTGAVVQRSIGDVVLGRVASAARNIPGYPLIGLVLGRDPISGESVERNATNLIAGVLSLIPGGAAIFGNLQQSGAIDRAGAWLNEETARLGLTYASVRATVSQVIDSMSGWQMANPFSAIPRIIGIFTPLVGRLRTFAVDAGRKVLEFIFEGVLTRAGPLGQQVLGVIRRAGDVFSTITRDPVGFAGNLIHAVGQGFRQFSANILQHLQQGLMAWLFGTLARSGLHLPERLDLSGVMSLALQILGLTYDHFRTVLVRLIGERQVAVLERTVEFLRTLVTQGLGAAWQKILEFASGLVDGVLSAIRDWVAQSVVGAAVTRILSMFNPAGAVIQAIIATYNTVQFFIERAGQIAAVASAVFDSIGRIAAGDVGQAAYFVEQSLARAIPVVLGFLSRLLGLGNIADHIRSVISRIQGVLNNALTRVGEWIATRARSLAGGARGGATPQDRLRNAVMAGKAAVEHLPGRRIGATLIRPALTAIRLRYGVGVLEPVVQGPRWAVHGELQRMAVVTDKEADNSAQSPGSRGTIQIQGGDINERNPGATRDTANQRRKAYMLSSSWSGVPITARAGRQRLASLWQALTTEQQHRRFRSYYAAIDWINAGPQNSPPGRRGGDRFSFQDPSADTDPYFDARVDVVIAEGIAFDT